MEPSECHDVDRLSDWEHAVDRLESDVESWLPPAPPAEEPAEPPRRGPAARLVVREPEFPWIWLVAGLVMFSVLVALQLLAMNLGASQGTLAAYAMSGALTLAFAVPLLVGRAWIDGQRRRE